MTLFWSIGGSPPAGLTTSISYPAPSSSSAKCEIGGKRALELFSRKWSLLTIYALFGGTKRLSELQREIDGVSQKMLIQTLRELEAKGLVERIVHPVVPPHVDYRLTPAGAALEQPLNDLCRWGSLHLPPSENETR